MSSPDGVSGSITSTQHPSMAGQDGFTIHIDGDEEEGGGDAGDRPAIDDGPNPAEDDAAAAENCENGKAARKEWRVAPRRRSLGFGRTKYRNGKNKKAQVVQTGVSPLPSTNAHPSPPSSPSKPQLKRKVRDSEAMKQRQAKRIKELEERNRQLEERLKAMEEASANEMTEVESKHRDELKKKDEQLRSLGALFRRDKKPAMRPLSHLFFIRPYLNQLLHREREEGAARCQEAAEATKAAAQAIVANNIATNKRIQAERACTSVKLETLTKQRDESLERERQGADAARRGQAAALALARQHRNEAAAATRRESTLESKLKKQHNQLQESREAAKKIRQDAATEKEALKSASWQKQQEGWDKLREVKRRSAEQLVKKNNQLTVLKREKNELGNLVEELTDAAAQLKKMVAVLEKKTSAKAELARKRLEKLRDSKSTVEELKGELALEVVARLELEERLTELEKWCPRTLKKVWQANASGRGGRQVWEGWVVQLILEMLSHRTPPTCIPANILTVAELLLPDANLVEELPGISFVRECRSVLVVLTKTLAAYQVGDSDQITQMISDGTKRRQTEIYNAVCNTLKAGQYKMITLSSFILPEDGTARCITASLVDTFRDAGELLEGWRDVTIRLYPDQPELADIIPRAAALSLARLNKAMVSMDGAAAARAYRKMYIEEVRKAAIELGIDESDIKVFEGDCWQHMRNVWFGGVIKALSASLDEILEDDLGEIPAIYRVGTDPVNLFRAMEKEFHKSANYAKGSGSLYHHYMHVYNPGAHHFQISRALGGTRQDIGSEGSMAALMNIPYFLEFLNWRMTCSPVENILMKNLFIILRSNEMVAMLRVLSILHIAICIPTRWLSGKCQELADADFGVFDMGLTVDLMEAAFEKIAADGSLLLDEDFVMNIFTPIGEKVKDFEKYLDHIFEEKQSFALGTRSDDEKWLPFDELRAQLFYPTSRYICQTHDVACQLAVVAANAFLAEFRNPTKATSDWLSSVGGVRSVANVTEEDRKATLGMDASTSISESAHANSTVGLKTWGTIRLDRVAAEGMSRLNGDFNRGWEALVTGRKAASGDIERIIGSFHQLPRELQESLIQFARENADKWKKNFDAALDNQQAATRKKEEIALKYKLDVTQEEYIVAIYFFEQFNSPRCWRTVADAEYFYNALPSASQRLNAVKEQILIRYLGLGWTEAHHPWSKDGTTYSSKYLFEHLKNVVIPLELNLKVPTEPPLSLPTPPEMPTLGTTSDIAAQLKIASDEKVAEFKAKCHAIRDSREADGLGDRWSEMQASVMPKLDSNLKGFKIEMLFSYPNTEDGTTYLNWCHGKVSKVINAKTGLVEINWDKECVNEKDKTTTRHKLIPCRWNPKTPKNGAWRQYLVK